MDSQNKKNHFTVIQKVNTFLLTLGADSGAGKGESSSPPNEVAVSSKISAGGGPPLLTLPAPMELSVSELSFSF